MPTAVTSFAVEGGKTEISHINNFNEVHNHPREMPPIYGWRWLLVVGAVAVFCVAFAAGYISGTKQAQTYYVSSSGIVHNQTCRYFREIPDAKNCQYCGGLERR